MRRFFHHQMRTLNSASLNFHQMMCAKTQSLRAHWDKILSECVFNEHPKLIQKGFQEKLKQSKEKIIGNQDSADCFNRALKFERIFQFLLPQGYLYRGGSKIWKDSDRNIVVIFQSNILRIVGFYVRHSAIDILEQKSPQNPSVHVQEPSN